MEILGVKFAPLNVPLNRLLETLSATLLILIFGLGYFLGYFLAAYFLFFTQTMRYFVLLYFVWMYYDWNKFDLGKIRQVQNIHLFIYLFHLPGSALCYKMNKQTYILSVEVKE